MGTDVIVVEVNKHSKTYLHIGRRNGGVDMSYDRATMPNLSVMTFELPEINRIQKKEQLT